MSRHLLHHLNGDAPVEDGTAEHHDGGNLQTQN
jgi:hypothetical protein